MRQALPSIATIQRTYSVSFAVDRIFSCVHCIHFSVTGSIQVNDRTSANTVMQPLWTRRRTIITRESTPDSHPFHCEFCDRKFHHKSTFSAHVRTHTCEKPYQCVICGKSFAQMATHLVHIRTHTGELRYPCLVCEKKFGQEHNLRLHMRTHTGEHPYKW